MAICQNMCGIIGQKRLQSDEQIKSKHNKQMRMRVDEKQMHSTCTDSLTETKERTFHLPHNFNTHTKKLVVIQLASRNGMQGINCALFKVKRVLLLLAIFFIIFWIFIDYAGTDARCIHFATAIYQVCREFCGCIRTRTAIKVM